MKTKKHVLLVVVVLILIDVKHVTAIKVDGQWSVFRDKPERCRRTCRHLVFSDRHCDKPRPSGGGLECIGAKLLVREDECSGGACQQDYKPVNVSKNTINGAWSDWEIYKKKTTCPKECTRIELLKRTCTDPPPSGGGQECSGTVIVSIRQTCSGDLCTNVNGQWSRWDYTRGPLGTCSDNCTREVTLVRTCTNSSPTAAGAACPGLSNYTTLAECSGDRCMKELAQWSAWSVNQTTECKRSCNKYIYLTRRCRDHFSTEDLGQCEGIASKIISKPCTGDGCKNIISAPVRDGSESWPDASGIVVTVIAVIVGVTLIVVTVIYLRRRRCQKKEQKENVCTGFNEIGDLYKTCAYDNPVFQADY